MRIDGRTFIFTYMFIKCHNKNSQVKDKSVTNPKIYSIETSPYVLLSSTVITVGNYEYLILYRTYPESDE
jgi:hypothetical protein